MDADFTILTSRRTTLELIMRRYVEQLDGVTIRPDCFAVRRLITEREAGGALRVTGVLIETEGGEERLEAAVVIDAGGKGGLGIEQLIEEGAVISEEEESAGIVYYTRHYRLAPGRAEPPRDGAPPASGDLGYLKFGVFPGDNGCFSITVCAPEIEYEMRKAIVRPEVWDRVMAGLPGLAVWTAPGQAEPVSRVFGMGDLLSRWRDMVVGDTPAALGFFALGDTLVRTNPLYGRGCSLAAVEAALLREVLDASADPKTRALAFHRRLRREIRPYYLAMRQADRVAIRRFRARP